MSAIILDVNICSCVFLETIDCHSKYKPISDWIFKKSGKIVCGGSKYKHELKQMKKYRRLIKTLRDKRQIIKLNDEAVDYYENNLEKLIEHKDFDDAHIVAIVIVSNCGVVCTGDSRSHKFLKDPNLYPEGVNTPKLYTNKDHKHLLYKDDLTSISYEYVES